MKKAFPIAALLLSAGFALSAGDAQ